MPLCPHTVPLPGWHCARPRLAKLPGRCCEEWVCDDDNRIREEEDVVDVVGEVVVGEEVVAEAAVEGDGRTPEQLQPAAALPQHPDLGSNELLVAPTPWDFTAGAPEQGRLHSCQMDFIFILNLKLQIRRCYCTVTDSCL